MVMIFIKLICTIIMSVVVAVPTLIFGKTWQDSLRCLAKTAAIIFILLVPFVQWQGPMP